MGGILIPACAEELGGQLGGLGAGDVIHLDLDADGLLLHFFDLSGCLCVHAVFLRFLCVFSLSVYTYITLNG